MALGEVAVLDEAHGVRVVGPDAAMDRLRRQFVETLADAFEQRAPDAAPRQSGWTIRSMRAQGNRLVRTAP